MRNYGFDGIGLSLVLGLVTACDATPSGDIIVSNDSALRLLSPSPSAVPSGTEELRLDKRAGSSQFEAQSASGWHSVHEGVWEHDGDPSKRLVVGYEGHRWLAAQATSRLEELRSLAATAENDAGAAQQIDALERNKAELVAASEAAHVLDTQASSITAVTCTASLYAGPSWPRTNNPRVAGALAMATITCTGGCDVFT
ncbi:MAG TPA: hypothetical protein VIV60_02595, partial [Polyangiaceae bacterium]